MSGTVSGITFTQSSGDTNIRIFNGKTMNFTIIWGGQAPIDVTGFTAEMQIRDLVGSLLMGLGVGTGITIGTSDGLITFTATPTQTAAVNVPSNYEIEVVDGSGNIFRAISGTCAPIEEFVL